MHRAYTYVCIETCLVAFFSLSCRLCLWPPACLLQTLSQVWSYLYTTAGEAVKKSYLANGGNAKSKPAPLAGLGYGLPLRCGNLLSPCALICVHYVGVFCFCFCGAPHWLFCSPRQLHAAEKVVSKVRWAQLRRSHPRLFSLLSINAHEDDVAANAPHKSSFPLPPPPPPQPLRCFITDLCPVMASVTVALLPRVSIAYSTLVGDPVRAAPVLPPHPRPPPLLYVDIL